MAKGEVAHSKKYETYKRWYEEGSWTKKMLRDSVGKGRITAAEYEEIAGGPYGA